MSVSNFRVFPTSRGLRGGGGVLGGPPGLAKNLLIRPPGKISPSRLLPPNFCSLSSKVDLPPLNNNFHVITQ